MTLDTDLLENEFIQRFGVCVNQMTDSVYDIASFTKHYNIIPENMSGINYREEYIEGKTKLPFDKFKIRIERIIEGYEFLNKEILTKRKSNLERSTLFKLTEIHVEQIGVAVEGFNKYLHNNLNETNYVDFFSNYTDQLKYATLAINGIMEIRTIYDTLADGTKARLNWAAKNSKTSE